MAANQLRPGEAPDDNPGGGYGRRVRACARSDEDRRVGGRVGGRAAILPGLGLGLCLDLGPVAPTIDPHVSHQHTHARPRRQRRTLSPPGPVRGSGYASPVPAERQQVLPALLLGEEEGRLDQRFARSSDLSTLGIQTAANGRTVPEDLPEKTLLDAECRKYAHVACSGCVKFAEDELERVRRMAGRVERPRFDTLEQGCPSRLGPGGHALRRRELVEDGDLVIVRLRTGDFGGRPDGTARRATHNHRRMPPRGDSQTRSPLRRSVPPPDT
ncbi:unnamed protein product [Diplocarpon coronariae]